jgi:hypothetical protein
MADHLWAVATFGQLDPLVFKRVSSIIVPLLMTRVAHNEASYRRE